MQPALFQPLLIRMCCMQNTVDRQDQQAANSTKSNDGSVMDKVCSTLTFAAALQEFVPLGNGWSSLWVNDR
jgi:hypothetical protein